MCRRYKRPSYVGAEPELRAVGCIEGLAAWVHPMRSASLTANALPGYTAAPRIPPVTFDGLQFGRQFSS